MMKKVIAVLLLASATQAFVVNQNHPLATTATNRCVEKSTALFAEEEEKKGGFFGAISNFFEELDAFVDDASMRRLGNGAKYYGKRKSSFYGKNDSMKKADKNKSDPTGTHPISANFTTVLCFVCLEGNHLFIFSFFFPLIISSEDYRITAGGNYKLMEDEDGLLRPVSLRRNVILDRLDKGN
jgi:hypothetical protein